MDSECNHKWNYWKVVKNDPKFVNCVRRSCIRCGESQFVRRLRDAECRREGTFLI